MVTVPMPVGETITSRELTPFEQVKTSSWEYTPLRPSRQWGGIRLSWTEKQSNKKAILRTIMQNNATNVTINLVSLFWNTSKYLRDLKGKIFTAYCSFTPGGLTSCFTDTHNQIIVKTTHYIGLENYDALQCKCKCKCK